MISRIRGTLTMLNEDFALVENGGVSYEILLPSALAERLKEQKRIGQEISFETIYYIEAGDKKSSHYPRLVGFEKALEREFFSLFLHVPGLGVKKALKSLIMPIRDIATAIETKDSGQLSRLPGVGARLADKIVAELHGKTAKFALSPREDALAVREREASPFADEALEVLLQLQYKRPEAEQMIGSALQSQAKIRNVEELLEVIFKNQQLREVNS